MTCPNTEGGQTESSAGRSNDSAKESLEVGQKTAPRPAYRSHAQSEGQKNYWAPKSIHRCEGKPPRNSSQTTAHHPTSIYTHSPAEILQPLKPETRKPANETYETDFFASLRTRQNEAHPVVGPRTCPDPSQVGSLPPRPTHHQHTQNKNNDG